MISPEWCKIYMILVRSKRKKKEAKSAHIVHMQISLDERDQDVCDFFQAQKQESKALCQSHTQGSLEVFPSCDPEYESTVASNTR